ncbi:Putative hydro-lyase [Frankliniella fusca]|uniref:Hydro-lyase n=1 Tax=Frankliniella fusca TaxID=407009 RepID=A0AAE1GQM3_9NEOP|nr:Putative hydro-lyase [Frankliniella fusca]
MRDKLCGSGSGVTPGGLVVDTIHRPNFGAALRISHSDIPIQPVIELSQILLSESVVCSQHGAVKRCCLFSICLKWVVEH